MNVEDKLIISETKSKKPGKWLFFKVFLGNICVADFETEISACSLEGKRELVYTIYKMRVNEMYRRNGVGTKIIKYCEQLAFQNGLTKLVVLVHPLDKNITFKNLISFYQKNGMKQIVDEAYNRNYFIKNLV